MCTYIARACMHVNLEPRPLKPNFGKEGRSSCAEGPAPVRTHKDAVESSDRQTAGWQVGVR